jgi:hypothetical protein
MWAIDPERPTGSLDTSLMTAVSNVFDVEPTIRE